MRNKSPDRDGIVPFLTLCVAFAFLVTSCQPAKTESGATNTIVFEGILEKLGPDPGVTSGRLVAYRLAKYRVKKVCSGKYERQEMVVDHLIFTGKEFEGIEIGDQLCLTVKVSDQIPARSDTEGIRAPEESVKTYYVATDIVRRVSGESACCDH